MANMDQVHQGRFREVGTVWVVVTQQKIRFGSAQKVPKDSFIIRDCDKENGAFRRHYFLHW
jgi:hypothetical protein